MKEMIIGKPRLLCFIFVLATMVGLGCFGGDGGGSSDHHCIDADGDGRGMYCMQGSDKDDSNPNVWTESGTCVDLDGDSYFAGCDAYVTVSYDCDDTKTSVHPGAMEIACGEALDNDCDGNVDESETVTFVDPNLESEVRTKISKATGIIISTDMCAIKMFWPSLDINDLTGLEYAYAMTDLRLIGSGPEICAFQMHYHPPLFMLAELSGSEPLDISHLSGLINLTNLEITAEHISDISPLSGLTNLTSLGLNCNNISDISPLSGMSMLRHIFLINNQITDTLTLKTLTNLQNVYLQGNALTAVPELSTMSNLLLLDLSHNYISDISNLSKLSKPGYLTYLYLNNNQIADISVLTNLTGLWDLDLANNQVADISVLSGLTQIHWLSLKNNKISDIFPLTGLPWSTVDQSLSVSYNLLDAGDCPDINILKSKVSTFYYSPQQNPPVVLTCL